MTAEIFEKLFVPYDESLALKELGFDDWCLALYTLYKHNLLIKPIPNQKEADEFFGGILAPTFDQAFTFFRDFYNIHHAMKPVLGSKNGYDSFPILGWSFDIFKSHKETQSYYMGYPIGDWFTGTEDLTEEGILPNWVNPLTYPQAEILALQTIIQIIKNGK
jgi:hypothetical protein